METYRGEHPQLHSVINLISSLAKQREHSRKEESGSTGDTRDNCQTGGDLSGDTT